MTRMLAPNDRGGRLCLNCARTHPEFPIQREHAVIRFGENYCFCQEMTGKGCRMEIKETRTVNVNDFAPDDS